MRAIKETSKTRRYDHYRRFRLSKLAATAIRYFTIASVCFDYPV
jgi:hypothetical protein